MNFILLALAIFAALIGILHGWRFMLFVAKKATFNSLFNAYSYAGISAGLLALAAWLFSAALS